MRFGRRKTPPEGGRRDAAKGTRPDNDRSPAQNSQDSEIESYLAAIAPDEQETAEHQFGRSHVYPLRLPEEAEEQLRHLAMRWNTSPLALVREWVLQRLTEETRRR